MKTKIPEVIQKVLAGDFPPPRAVDRSIPAPLEAICLKAMAKEPEARYDSVRALAQDLEHWLADEPTAAYPESRVEKVGRWIRQHRAWTYRGGRGARGHLDGRDRSPRSVHREASPRQRRSKPGRPRGSRDQFRHGPAGRRRLPDQRQRKHAAEGARLGRHPQPAPGLAQERARLITSNSPHSGKTTRGSASNWPRPTFESGRSPGKSARQSQAMDAFRSAQAIWEPLVEANPKSHELAGNLAECYLAMGKLESFDDNFPAALEDARTLARDPGAAHAREPAEPRYQASLADCYSEIGIALAKLEKPDESLAIHEKARAIQQGLIDRYPDNLAYKKGLAENLNAIGFAYYKRQRDNAAALKTFHEVRGHLSSAHERSCLTGPSRPGC